MDLSQGYDAYPEERRNTGTSLISQAERKRRNLHREIGEVRFEFHSTERCVFESLLSWKPVQLARFNIFDVFKVEWLINLLRLLCTVQSTGSPVRYRHCMQVTRP